MTSLFKLLRIAVALFAINIDNRCRVFAANNTMDSNIPALTLNTGKMIPSIGYGTSRANDEELERALNLALEAGYRHIDTASYYLNEKAIGKVTKKWITDGRLKREDLFLVTKLPPFGNRPEGVSKYLKKSLEYLQMDYVDLYLVHAPFAMKEDGYQAAKTSDGNMIFDVTSDHLALWKEMEKQVDAGLTREIGLSNFNKTQIERILKSCKIKPSCLQIELHAYLQQNELVDFCKKNDILVTAYSPLGSRSIASSYNKPGIKFPLPDVLANPTVKKIAKKHSKTEAQVVLRFDIQRGVIPIPKSTNPERLKQNLNVFDFELDEEDIHELKGLDAGLRFFDFKSIKNIEKHPEYPFRDEIKE